MKLFLEPVLLVLLSVALALLFLEGVLRFLPVNEGLRAQPVNAVQPVFHFEPGLVATGDVPFDVEKAVAGAAG